MKMSLIQVHYGQSKTNKFSKVTDTKAKQYHLVSIRINFSPFTAIQDEDNEGDNLIPLIALVPPKNIVTNCVKVWSKNFNDTLNHPILHISPNPT